MRNIKFHFSRLLIVVTIVGAMLVLGACTKTPPSTTATTTTAPTTTTTTTATLPAPTLTITSPASSVSAPGDVTVTVQVTNFNVVDKQGQSNVQGQGHLHYYLDADAPTTQGQPAVLTSGVWAHVATTSYTFTNVSAGSHTISVQLVNNNHTPLNPPVVQKITFNVTAATTTPTAPTTPTTTTTTTTTGGTPVTISLVAQGMAFNMSTITVPAGVSVTMNFDNQDSGIPHNFAAYTNSSASTSIFVGQMINGPSKVTYTFTAPATPGTYYFRCDAHPFTMTGSFIVTP